MDKYQFLKEEERLDYTLQTLNEEILNYIEKRKEIANYILDYRKNFIEEHKDDEDASFLINAVRLSDIVGYKKIGTKKVCDILVENNDVKQLQKLLISK